MKITQTSLHGVYLVNPICHVDSRGWFMETYSKLNLEKNNLCFCFVQDNHSYTAEKGTIRGLHFQNDPKSQTKLLRCTRGRILDVAVDLRKGSPQYKKWVAVELSSDNRLQLLIPRGFGHGFATLTDDVEIQYKVDEYYSQSHDRSIRYNDPEIGIDWGIADPILSEKDNNALLLKDSDCNFIYQDGM